MESSANTILRPNPLHTIYSFSICIIELVTRKGRKLNKTEVGIGTFLRQKSYTILVSVHHRHRRCRCHKSGNIPGSVWTIRSSAARSQRNQLVARRGQLHLRVLQRRLRGVEQVGANLSTQLCSVSKQRLLLRICPRCCDALFMLTGLFFKWPTWPLYLFLVFLNNPQTNVKNVMSI